MPIGVPDPKVKAVQIIIVRGDGDEETIQSLDIPVRHPSNFDMTLDNTPSHVHMKVDLRVDPSYTIQYVIRNTKDGYDKDKLSPYSDGLYSEQDVARIKAKMWAIHDMETLRLKKRIRKLLKKAGKEVGE